MTWTEILQIIGGTAGAAALIVSGWLAYKSNTAAKQIEATATPYEAMSRHVNELTDDIKELRQEIEELRSERWTDRTYIRDIHDAWPRDRPFTVQWAPAWVAQQYGMQHPHHPPTPGSVIRPPRPKEQ